MFYEWHCISRSGVTCPSINWIKVEFADIPSDKATTRIGYLSLLNFQRYPGNDRNEKLAGEGKWRRTVCVWKRWKIYNYAGEFLFPFLGILICPVDGGYGLRWTMKERVAFEYFSILRFLNWIVYEDLIGTLRMRE